MSHMLPHYYQHLVRRVLSPCYAVLLPSIIQIIDLKLQFPSFSQPAELGFRVKGKVT